MPKTQRRRNRRTPKRKTMRSKKSRRRRVSRRRYKKRRQRTVKGGGMRLYGSKSKKINKLLSNYNDSNNSEQEQTREKVIEYDMNKRKKNKDPLKYIDDNNKDLYNDIVNTIHKKYIQYIETNIINTEFPTNSGILFKYKSNIYFIYRNHDGTYGFSVDNNGHEYRRILNSEDGQIRCSYNIEGYEQDKYCYLQNNYIIKNIEEYNSKTDKIFNVINFMYIGHVPVSSDLFEGFEYSNDHS